jgi:hypothetical protein
VIPEWTVPDWMRDKGRSLGPDLSGYTERKGYEHPDAPDSARGLVRYQAFDSSLNPNTQYFQVIPGGYYDSVQVCAYRTTPNPLAAVYFRFGKLQAKQGAYPFNGVAAWIQQNPPQVFGNEIDGFTVTQMLRRSFCLTNAPFLVWFRDDTNPVATNAYLAIVLMFKGDASGSDYRE